MPRHVILNEVKDLNVCHDESSTLAHVMLNEVKDLGEMLHFVQHDSGWQWKQSTTLSC
jgi:hypothetical protein